MSIFKGDEIIYEFFFGKQIFTYKMICNKNACCLKFVSLCSGDEKVDIRWKNFSNVSLIQASKLLN